MKVLSYTQADFERECHRLKEAVRAGFGSWDVVLGIASGGVPVARRLLPDSGREPLTLTLRRPSTEAVKGGALKRVLSRLPRPMLDALRIVESKFYSLCDRRKGADPKPPPLEAGLTQVLRRLEAEEGRPLRILIADDAADSGTTIRRVRRAVEEFLPDAVIATAVVTVTRATADDAVDFALYRNGTLIRFPWSSV